MQQELGHFPTFRFHCHVNSKFANSAFFPKTAHREAWLSEKIKVKLKMINDQHKRANSCINQTIYNPIVIGINI